MQARPTPPCRVLPCLHTTYYLACAAGLRCGAACSARHCRPAPSLLSTSPLLMLPPRPCLAPALQTLPILAVLAAVTAAFGSSLPGHLGAARQKQE
jgi:hypothetical protein